MLIREKKITFLFRGHVKHVRLGTTNFVKHPDQTQEFEIESIIVHPEYKYPKAYNDIAVLVLKKNVTMNNKVRPICFEKVADLNGKDLIATGWGVTNFGESEQSEDLKKIEFKFTNYDICKHEYESRRKLPNGILEEQHICATPKYAGRDTCQVICFKEYREIRNNKPCNFRAIQVVHYK